MDEWLPQRLRSAGRRWTRLARERHGAGLGCSHDSATDVARARQRRRRAHAIILDGSGEDRISQRAGRRQKAAMDRKDAFDIPGPGSGSGSRATNLELQMPLRSREGPERRRLK